jgi:hypothetical protein
VIPALTAHLTMWTTLLLTLAAQVPDPALRPYLQAPTDHSIWVAWKTSSGLESRVDFGSDGGPLDQSASGSTQVLSDVGYPNNYYYHLVRLDGLDPDSAYQYRVRTGDLVSETFRFRTQPPPGASGGLYRFLILGDHQLISDDRYERLVAAAVEQVEARYGAPLEDAIRCVLNVGDQVDVGTLEHYEKLHFKQSAQISPYLPILTIVGNHETYGTLGLGAYYSHFVLDEMQYAGITSGTENYYATQLGPLCVLALSSEHPSTAQRTWAHAVIDAAAGDSSVDFLISLGHRPTAAEQYVGDISPWIRDQILPKLEQTPKAMLHVGAHHHLYARGQQTNAPLYHIISGGAAWDQLWGMSNEQDFVDVQKTIDNWPYQIVELDPATRRMSVETFTIGNALIDLDNVQIDSFSRQLGQPAPQTPAIVPLAPGPVQLPVTVVSTDFSQPSGAALQSTQFQVALSSDFVDLELDQLRAHENLYGTTPLPSYQPIDLNQGLDLLRLEIPANALLNGNHWVRVRHRDRNLEWSAWSPALPFEVVGSLEGFPEISLNKSQFALGEPIQVAYAFGPGDPQDWIGIYTQGTSPGSTPSVVWKYVTGSSGTATFSLSSPGLYYAAFFSDDGYVELGPRVEFYLGPVPVLEVGEYFKPSGASVSIAYSEAPGLPQDWIGVYRVGNQPGEQSSTLWKYASGASGTLQFNELPDGFYFANYFLLDAYEEPGQRVHFALGGQTSQLSTTSSTYSQGEPIPMQFSGGPGTPKDWLGIFEAAANPSSDPLTAFLYVDGQPAGQKSFDGQLLPPPGSYFCALFINDSYTEVSNRVYFDVLPACGHSSYGVTAAGVVAQLSASPNPAIGGLVTYEAQGLPGPAGLIALTSAAAQLPIFGGTLLVNPAAIIALEPLVLAQGTGSRSFAVPANPNLAGQSVFIQAAAPRTDGSGLWDFTQGLETRLCP